MLPACKVCLENGCNIIVLGARQNAEANQAIIDSAVVREAGRKEHDAIEAVAKAIATPVAIAVAYTVATPVATPDAPSASKPKSKKRTPTRCVCLYLIKFNFASFVIVGFASL